MSTRSAPGRSRPAARARHHASRRSAGRPAIALPARAGAPSRAGRPGPSGELRAGGELVEAVAPPGRTWSSACPPAAQRPEANAVISSRNTSALRTSRKVGPSGSRPRRSRGPHRSSAYRESSSSGPSAPAFFGPDERPDMVVQVPLVHHVDAGADVDHLEVAVEELIDGRCGPRITLLVDRVHHPSGCRTWWARQGSNLRPLGCKGRGYLRHWHLPATSSPARLTANAVGITDKRAFAPRMIPRATSRSARRKRRPG
jgi:hypothetical protein